MLQLYDFMPSGNGYKVRLALRQLGIAYELHEIDILKRETHTAAFLAINPDGKIPALVLEDGTALAESDAILWYLAEGTALLPEGRLERAQVLQWMFFEQYSHEPYIAVARFIAHFAPDDPRAADLPRIMQRGHKALGVMEQHLSRHDFFVAGRYSIADIALYGYTHCADEGGFDLAAYPAIGRWLARVRAMPGHIPIATG